MHVKSTRSLIERSIHLTDESAGEDHRAVTIVTYHWPSYRTAHSHADYMGIFPRARRQQRGHTSSIMPHGKGGKSFSCSSSTRTSRHYLHQGHTLGECTAAADERPFPFPHKRPRQEEGNISNHVFFILAREQGFISTPGRESESFSWR